MKGGSTTCRSNGGPGNFPVRKTAVILALLPAKILVDYGLWSLQKRGAWEKY